MQKVEKKSNNSEAQNTQSAMSVREAGARGGRATLERLGTDFFREIGRKGGRRTRELYGSLFSEYGRRGGRPRRPCLADTNLGEDSR